MNGNDIWNSLVSNWGLLLVGIGFVIIIGKHFLSDGSSIMKSLGLAAVWAVLCAIMYNVESLRNFGDGIWTSLTGG